MKKVLVAAVAAASVMILGSSAQAEDVRFEIGGGGVFNTTDISFAGASDELDTDTGLALAGALWFDRVGSDVLSLGLQFERHSDADYNETVGGTILGVALTANANVQHDINMFLAMAALRDNTGSMMGDSIHPYLGAGVGVARTNADIDATITVNGQTITAGTSDSDTSVAGQVFTGIDFDLTDSVYFGLNASYSVTNANLFGADVDFADTTVMAKIGFKF